MESSYRGTSTEIIVAPVHAHDSVLWEKIKNISPRFRKLRDKYYHYTHEELCENTGILHLPYQVSVMSLFEQYAMGIPVLVPSLEFLWVLHDSFNIMSERTWEMVMADFETRPSKSVIFPHSDTSSWSTVPDPNNDIEKDAFLHWVKYSDYYQWPHIVQFDSWDDLEKVINTTDWRLVSSKMKEHFDLELREIRKKWLSLLE